MIIYQDEPFYLQNKFAEYKREKTAQSNSSRDRSVRRVRSKKKVLNQKNKLFLKSLGLKVIGLKKKKNVK